MVFLLVLAGAVVVIFQDQPWLLPVVLVLLAWKGRPLVKLWWWTVSDPFIRLARRLRG